MGLLVAIAAALALTSFARAERGAFWLDANLASKHSEKNYVWENREHRYNERNFGLGATYEFSAWGEVKAGWFDNSYRRTSVYGMVNLKKNLLSNQRWLVAPGLAAGLVTGYQNTPEQTGALAPWGLVTLSIGDSSRWRVNLGYLPSRLFRKNTIDFGTLQVSWRL